MQPYHRRHSPQLALLMLGATSDSLHVKRVRFPRFTSHKFTRKSGESRKHNFKSRPQPTPRHVFAAHVLTSVINHRLGNLECLRAEPEALADGEISGFFNTMKWSLHDVQETVPGIY
jgi:hypothetical protein